MKLEDSSDGADFETLVNRLKSSLPILPVSTSTDDLISLATKITIVIIAQELLSNHALTLNSAYDIFTHQIQTLVPMSSLDRSPELPSHRWLLSQLSAALIPHMAYTCKVRKHGVILYRKGKEIEALSYALYQLNKTKQDADPPELNSDVHKSVCVDVNKKIHKMVSNNLSNSSFELNDFIAQADPVVWETISILTSSTSGKQPQSAPIRDLRRAFILSLIMYCIDSRSSMPFQLILADTVDCNGGSTELLKILNRLGVCTSSDTLLRHIQTTVQQSDMKGILQDLDPSILTVFSMDNIDIIPLLPTGKEVIIQLSSPGARELNLLHLHKLVDALKRDPDMIHIPHTQITGIIQTMFASTGCDYVSFFSGIGKPTFLKTFFEKADFISNDSTGQLSKMPETMQELTERGFLAFARLVGCAYFKKHRNAFQGTTPEALFHSFATDNVKEQHNKWLEHIRQKIWDRIMFEDDMIPSVGALKRHWKRSCWVLHM